MASPVILKLFEETEARQNVNARQNGEGQENAEGQQKTDADENKAVFPALIYTLKISNLDNLTVENLLKWIYSGEIGLANLHDFDLVSKLYRAAHMYEIYPLKSYLSSQVMIRYINANNATKFLELGNVFDDQVLIQAANRIIKRLEK